MKTLRFIPTLVVVILFSMPGCQHPVETNTEISFDVKMGNPASHYFEVEMWCRNFNQDTLEVLMPVWTPGYYLVLDLAKNVVDFSATDGEGNSLSSMKSRKNGWKIVSNKAKEVKISYYVYSTRRSVADPYLDSLKAFISPTGIFMHPDGEIEHPVIVTIHPPKEFSRISTGLDPVEDQVNTFSALNFDRLYDCPILVANQELLQFEVNGRPHYIAIENIGNADRDQLTHDLQRIVESASELMVDIPYKHYTFLIMENGMGGLEHLNSMAVYSDVTDYSGERSQTGWLGFIAHEFFHLYNVKSIRPIVLGPFDYNHENLTNMLWLSEGGTVYYQEILINRAGFITADQFLSSMERTIQSHENIPGHLFQSAAQSSWDTWMLFFNRSANARDVTINYYNKGCTLSMLLDLKIRHETGNGKSLDDVMRLLYRDFSQSQHRGFTDQEFREVCEKMSGADFSEFFNQYVYSTSAIDYPKYLAYAGLSIDLTPLGEPEVILGKTFQKRSLKISRLENPDTLQQTILASWLRQP